MKVLAIETSCDESGLALLDASGGVRAPRFRVGKSLVASQIKIHRPFGGVVPNLAKREHLKNLPILYRKMFGAPGSAAEARLWRSIDLVTVTVGPGLEPALWTGIEFAKRLAAEHGKPLVGANHLEGHLYSFLLSGGAPVRFPAVALIVSGGHTILLEMASFTKWRRLGETRDDAAGEAFDKVARLLDLPYPGGPEIEKLAREERLRRPAHPDGTIAFPRPMLHDKSYDFSFSGLKTAVLYHVRAAEEGNGTAGAHGAGTDVAHLNRRDIAASFQAATLDVLAAKTVRAVREYGARSVLLSGGVAANKALRARLRREARKIGSAFFVPSLRYNLDNAAMIGAAGYLAHLRKKRYKLEARGDLDI